MWEVIVTRISRSNALIDVLSDLWTGSMSFESWVIVVLPDLGIDELADAVISVLTSSEVVDIGIDMLAGAGIIATVDSAWIDFDVVVTLSYDAGDALTIVRASSIGDDMLVDVDADVFAAAITALKFIVPTPLADSVTSCWAAPRCWMIADLECARAAGYVWALIKHTKRKILSHSLLSLS